MQGPEGRPPNVSPARKGWEIDPEEDPSAVGAALFVFCISNQLYFEPPTKPSSVRIYVRDFLGANYFVILEQQGVITSLLPVLPHDYFPGSWTAAPERITVGHKTRLLCQTGRIEATVVALCPATRGIAVNERGGCPA
jgi:hypothetical protein